MYDGKSWTFGQYDRNRLLSGVIVILFCAGTCEAGKAFLESEDMYHPMLENPVANTIKEERGVLVTGSNASGKSTFLKILSGQLEPTNGSITMTPGQRLSVLEQDHFKYDDFTVLDTVIMGNARLYEIMKEKDAIYAKEDFSDEDGIRAASWKGNSPKWTAGKRNPMPPAF